MEPRTKWRRHERICFFLYGAVVAIFMMDCVRLLWWTLHRKIH